MMSIDLNCLEFQLNTDPVYFNIRMNEILEEIRTQLPQETDMEPLMQKSRWVLTELVTNAYKHSGKTEIFLRIQFNPGHLIITKEDLGIPLNFNLSNGSNICWPLSPFYFERDFDVFSDQVNILNAKINTQGHVRFMVKQNVQANNLPQKMNEHFGLIIIASVCAEFTYVYDTEAGKNIFSAHISY